MEVREFIPSFPIPDRKHSVNAAKGWVFILRKGDETDLQLKVSCTLTDPTRGTCSGLDTGEYLDALSIEKGTHVLSIGTEDSDAIRHRAERNQWMPRRLAQTWKNDRREWRKMVEFGDYGLSFNVPELHADEKIFFHVICALGSKVSVNDISTHIMVDQPVQKLMAHMGLQ